MEVDLSSAVLPGVLARVSLDCCQFHADTLDDTVGDQVLSNNLLAGPIARPNSEAHFIARVRPSPLLALRPQGLPGSH